MTVPMISIATLRGIIPVREGNAAVTARIKTAIIMATAQIESQCRRQFSRSQRTEFHPSRNTARVVLDLGGASETGVARGSVDQVVRVTTIPVDMTQPVEVRYDPNGVFGDDTIVPAHLYSVDAVTGRVIIRAGTRYSSRGFQVTYTGGYAAAEAQGEGWDTLEDAIDAPLRTACMLQAAHIYNKLDPNVIGLKGDVMAKKGPPEFVVKGGLIPDVVSLVWSYRRLGAGG